MSPKGDKGPTTGYHGAPDGNAAWYNNQQEMLGVWKKNNHYVITCNAPKNTFQLVNVYNFGPGMHFFQLNPNITSKPSPRNVAIYIIVSMYIIDVSLRFLQYEYYLLQSEGTFGSWTIWKTSQFLRELPNNWVVKILGGII